MGPPPLGRLLRISYGSAKGTQNLKEAVSVGRWVNVFEGSEKEDAAGNHSRSPKQASETSMGAWISQWWKKKNSNWHLKASWTVKVNLSTTIWISDLLSLSLSFLTYNMQVILTPSLEECEKLEHFYQGHSSGMYELSDIIVSWQRRVQPASTGQAARDHRWADSSLFLGGGQRRCSPDPIPQEEQLSSLPHSPCATAPPPPRHCHSLAGRKVPMHPGVYWSE